MAASSTTASSWTAPDAPGPASFAAGAATDARAVFGRLVRTRTPRPSTLTGSGVQTLASAEPGAPVVSASLGVALAMDAGVRDRRGPRGVGDLARVTRRVPVAALDRVCTPLPAGRPCESLALWSML